MNNARISKDFFKHVPIEKQAVVLEKLKTFTKMVSNANVFHEIPKGFWIRKIVGTNIYKFRVNSGDRILFTFHKDGSITYLSFETHDTQIQSAKRTHKEDYIGFVIDETTYEEEAIDENINRYALQELVGKLNIISNQEVMDDEYVTLLLDDDELFDSANILTREQYEALNNPTKLTVVFGCAGSGKTNIGIRRLLLHHELNIPTVYVSHSPYLMNETRRQFTKRATAEGSIQFFSLLQLFEKLLNQSFTLITQEDFVLWYKESNLQNHLSPAQLFLEINTVIKGQTLYQIMSQEEYYVASSDFSLQEKRDIYFVASLYQRWLEKNQYVDLNDLAFLILQGNGQQIGSVVFDEIQELTPKQFESLLHISKSAAQHLLLGDPYQAIENYAFQPEQIYLALSKRDIPYQKFILSKNFRSGYQVVKLLNQIKAQELAYYPSTNRMDEIAIRSTSTPKIIVQKEITQGLLQKLDQDADSILIVATQEAKKQLQMQGFRRIFVASEVQGLQYKNVYCQNVLQHFTIENLKQHQLFKAYFHLMYIAASRTTQHIYFVEERQPKNILMGLFEDCHYQLLVELESGTTTTLEWLQEARKLELLGKFEQALDAYTKAQDLNGMTRCQSLLLRARNYEHLETYLSVIHFDFNSTGPQQIKRALQLLKEQHIQLIGHTMYYISHDDGSIKFDSYFIEPGMHIEQLSHELYSRIDYSYAVKYTLHVVGVFYQGNEPILISEKLSNMQLNDIRFFEKDSRLHYQLAHLAEPRHILKKYADFEKQKQPTVFEALKGFDVDVVIENAKKKETAEDFLKDIFG